MADTDLILNGIDGSTGDYFTAPMTAAEAAVLAGGQAPDAASLQVLQNLAQQANQAHLGLPFDRDPKRLTEAGWCVVFHQQEDDAVKKALAPLVEHRRKQIGDDRIVKVLEYVSGENLQRWLAKYQVAPGSVVATRVPLYILLVGGADRIPFDFGHMLDVEYCVGRLHFDTPAGYQRYVESVIAYETAASAPNPRRVAFWAPSHPNDAPTRMSSQLLVAPLVNGQPGQQTVLQRISDRTGTPFTPKYFAAQESTRANLTSVFRPDGGGAAPAFLFTASHGMGWPLNHPQQATDTGALICQDFPGAGFGPLQRTHYFAAADLPPDAHVHGMVSFHFACFGAGVPMYDRFTHQRGTQPRQIAPAPFFSPLPKALLSHPNGGALAVIGHVERAWASSISATGAGVQLGPFENVMGYILLGLPVGYALKDFNERYASLSTALASLLENRDFGMAVTDTDLAQRWTERNDAEAYTLMGDPGVRVRVDALQAG